MFNKAELNYLFGCVEGAVVSNTQTARNKASMMLKLCDLMDVPDAEEPQTKHVEDGTTKRKYTKKVNKKK